VSSTQRGDPNVTLSIYNIRQSRRQRFYDLKQQAEDRIGMGELAHREFMNLLLDVYELHLDRDEE